MTDEQLAHYGSARDVHSDPFGLISRENRNHRKKQRRILETLRVGDGSRVLEVGCGSGLHSTGYHQRFDYTGIDLSPSLVAETQARLEGVSSPYPSRVLEMDAHSLPFAADSYDAVVGTAILHHLADQQEALAEWIRVTRPGGQIVLMEPNYLFPKDLLLSQFIEAEKHKAGMAPWRLRRVLDSLEQSHGISGGLSPEIYTLPWPARFHGLYDRIDESAKRLPGVRWLSQMLLITITVADSA